MRNNVGHQVGDACLVAVAVLSAYCSLHTANTVSMIPGNQNFDKCVEFSDPYRIFWGPTAYKITQVLFYFTAVCLNIAAIIDTAEGMSMLICTMLFAIQQVEILQMRSRSF